VRRTIPSPQLWRADASCLQPGKKWRVTLPRVCIYGAKLSADPFLDISSPLILILPYLFAVGGKRTPCPPPPRLSTEGASLSHCNTAGPDIRRCAARWPGVEVLPPASRSSASLPQGDGVEVTPSCMQVRASAHLPTGKFFSVADCRGLCTDHYLWLLLVKDKCISIESIRKIYDIQNAFFDELLVEII